MKRRLKFILPAISLILSSIFAVLITPSNASAATVEDQKYKYIARAMYKCYVDGYVSKTVDPSGKHQLKEFVNNDEKVVGMPPDFLGDDDEYTCAKFLSLLPGLNGLAVDDILQDASQTIAVLDKLGYVPGDKPKCEQFDFKFQDSNKLWAKLTPTICGVVGDGDKISKLTFVPSEYTATPGDDQSKVTISFGVGPESGFANGEVGLLINSNPRNEIRVSYKPGETTWTKLLSDLKAAAGKYKYDPANGDPLGQIYDSASDSNYYYDSDRSVEPSAGATTYKISLGDNPSYETAYQKLVGRAYPGSNVDPKERLALYQDYIVSYYGAEVAGCADKESDVKKDEIAVTNANDPTSWQLVKIFKSDGSAQYCFARATKNATKEIFGVEAGTSKNWPSMPNAPGRIGFLGIVSALYNNDIKSIGADLASGIGQPATVKPGEGPSSGNDSEEEKKDEGSKSCFDGAGALGWVLCPILEGTSWAINQLYSGFIEPALTINADLLTFDGNGDKGAYATWQTFQTFANIAFVIMILVVIFSQLTGVGIDNYGIKRILPRLIIAAILINLSFIICQLLVDLSNILGVSLKNLFNSLGPDYKSVGGSTGGAIFVDILIGVVAVGGAFLALGLGVLIPILVAAISALIAIFFLFLVLAGRQAAVVILVVISPIALVMYMLPNTKKYFDKFVKIFVTLLVVFPVCGLLMGGGDFASRVLLQAGQASANSFSSTGEGFFYQISAVLVSIVPFFFIPSLVKGSLAGLGNIGSKISGIGSKVGGKASGTARGALDKSRLGLRAKARQSDRAAYKDMQFQRRRAGFKRNGEESWRGKRRRMFANGESGLGKLANTKVGNVFLRGSLERSQLRQDSAQSGVLRDEMRLQSATSHLGNYKDHIAAARAGISSAEMEQQIKDQTALLNQRGEDGIVPADSIAVLKGQHADALNKLAADPSDSEAQAKMSALQNMLVKTEDGRAAMKDNFAEAVNATSKTGGSTAGITVAASQLMNNHGDTIKSVDRGFNNWAAAASGGEISSMASHSADGAKKYTAQSLAGADEGAISGLVEAYNNGTLGKKGEGDAGALERTAWEALNNENVQIKPEIREKLQGIASNYTPQQTVEQREAQAQTQALNDINDQLRHIGGQQGGGGSAPQNPPRESGTSTEDWEDYLNGTGDFAP